MEFYYRGVDKDVLILRADGGIDATNAHEFLTELSRLIEGGIRRLIVDCSGLGHISSSGIALLFRLHRRLLAAGGHVKLAAVPGPVFRLLELTKLSEVFEIYPSVDAASAAFREGG
jgi:anti-sigma B factor antagonist